jgi:hypothetical protein
MIVDTAEAYSILGFIGGAALSKCGGISLCYYLINPEPYSLSQQAIEYRQTEFERALRFMPSGSYFHKQDVYLKKAYDAHAELLGDTFLQKAERSHFDGREYLEHHCVLSFTLAGLESLEPAYMKNPLAYQDNLVERDKARLAEFIEAVEGVNIILKNLPNTTIRRLEQGEIVQFVDRYVNGFAADNGKRDLYFGPHMTIGEARASVFAVCDETALPDELPVYIEDDTLPKANATLFMACLEKLGLHLRANHIINQIIYFEGNNKLKAELEARADQFHKHRHFKKELEITAARLQEMQVEVIESQAHLCRAHFSIILWDTEEKQLTKAKDAVKEALKMRDFGHYQPSYIGLRNIFLGTVIGRENILDRDFFFLTELSIATGLFVNHSPYVSDTDGVFFNDRIFQIPYKLDIWDEQKKRIPARNSLFISSTGGGKSSTVLNIVEQEIRQGVKVVAVEFGKSFLAVSRLYPSISAHIDYDGVTPLGINPFYIESTEELTTDKIKTLAVLVLKFWREKVIVEDTKQYISVVKIIRDYYNSAPVRPSFPDFYLYVKNNIDEILTRQEIPPDYFTVTSFLHICSEFMPGGLYENVCRTDGTNADLIRGKDFIVFELTRIKKDPFLVSIIMTIIYETVENKILADRSIRGKIYFDEYAETATMKDNFSGEDVHSTVAFFFQKLRKENGGISAVIQSPAQLPDNNLTDGVIANTQIIYVLPTTETVYSDICTTFKITNPAHIQLMKSIRNDFVAPRPYAEVFIRFQDLYATVVRLEFSRAKFYAYQTDGKDWQRISDDFKETGSMEAAITNIIKSRSHEKIML